MDIQKLRRLAEAATPGPWVVSRSTITRPGQAAVKEVGAFDWICSMQISNQPNWDRDAEFVAAANPAVVLALIDRIAALESGQC
jgi:hypothetical protein